MDAQTITTYDRWAEDYDRKTVEFWENFPRGFVDRFVELSDGGSVLDVGSGPGRDGLLLVERGLDVTCLDASAAMVERCREQGMAAVQGDFAVLPFEDGSFDAVWAYTSLLHVPKSEVSKPLAEIFRVLRPGRVLGLGMIEGDRELYRTSSGVGEERWFSFYAKNEIERLLVEGGFEILHFETFQPSSKTYLNYIARKK
ncbi:MAG: class I SAM-dependent methyltransferase [bacterium]